MSGLDRLLLGLLASIVAAGLAAGAMRSQQAACPKWLARLVTIALVTLALVVQVAALVILLSRSNVQDGLLSGDVRLRNLVGVAATAVVWIGVGCVRLLRVRPRRGKRGLHSS